MIDRRPGLILRCAGTGGGDGYLSHRLGLTCDQFESLGPLVFSGTRRAV